ncbi:unnamed protein product [Caenorhabditis angaria]|uniref:C-type lectin domain-containing protein n=1 Tax=Caenorhabditis angaria TaxID=860376 RepID=A0A9P1I892_9PELO|nr:unnamed protein product [Caenorhabditis angaria]
MDFFIKNLVIFVLVFTKCSIQQIQDQSFQKFCSRFNQAIVTQTIETDDSGVPIPNPVGDRCTIEMDFPATDTDQAKMYCERWGLFALAEWKAVENRVSCTYENVYECSNNYQQIRGMCYRPFYDLNTYEEAEKTCEDSVSGAKIVQISKHLGELFEFAFGDDLSMYFVQPDKTLELSSMFVGQNSTEAEDQNKNYVILFNYGIHYDVGPNTIIKLDKTVKAFAMCMYKPPETILSFGINAKKLAELYHPTQLVGAMAVWRSASHYTPALIPGYPYSHKDVCEASMKAILGTSDGTFLNLKPANTKRLSPENYRRQIYFVNKKVIGISCENQANLRDSDYDANWHRELNPVRYSFVYFPEKKSNSLSFEALPLAIHSPMLCGLHYEKDVNRQPQMCKNYWTPYHPNMEMENIKDIMMLLHFALSKKGDLSRWESYSEYIFVRSLRTGSCGGSCDAWVKCYDVNGCRTYQSKDGARPDLQGSSMNWLSADYGQSVICEQPAYQTY